MAIQAVKQTMDGPSELSGVLEWERMPWPEDYFGLRIEGSKSPITDLGKGIGANRSGSHPLRSTYKQGRGGADNNV
jgi:hypothetical protein